MSNFETSEQTYPSVSALNETIRSTVQSLGGGVVEAEIRSLTLASSGHCYITLADADCEIRAVMWRGTVGRQRSLPAEGDLVDAHFDKVDFYPPRGSLQIVLSRLEPTGEGALLRRRAETLRRLESEGLTSPDRKPPLARFPKKIGLIAGKDSDAMHDVIKAVRDRCKSVPIIFCPALVQGVHSPMSVVAAIATLCQTQDVETIIVARGGGSVTDLAAFDDEQLCRAIFASPVPVITSIGHTKDRPVCDFVSAAHAPVPAKAAEFALAVSDEEVLRTLDDVVVPTLGRVREQLDATRAGLDSLAAQVSLHRVARRFDEQLAGSRALFAEKISRLREGHGNYERALARMSSELFVSGRRSLSFRVIRIGDASTLLVDRAHSTIDKRRSEVSHQLDLLAASDISARGAIFVTSESGRPARSVGELESGQHVQLNFADGTAGATIDNTTERKESE
jgi:exodeoxyribonuclease VII large subunit